MKRIGTVILSILATGFCASAQSSKDSASFQLALAAHQGQMQWRAEGFKIVQSSAKPAGREIGIRATDNSGLTFLAFLFLIPEQNPLTGAKCRDIELDVERKQNPAFKISSTSEIDSPGNLPIALASYTHGGAKKTYAARGFVATSDICGDIEFYDQSPITASDPRVHNILTSVHLDPNYLPQFRDVFLYAEILYRSEQYGAAAPLFERALAMVPSGKDEQTQTRVLTDQAGMAYGISGNIAKAREIFNAAIVKDPDYPLYYYNLACADAEENKLADARVHLQQAFARKANIIPGETMPDPTKDDSFTPYRNNRDFWTFLQGLH
jgi:tetratricopeptide (TPR) repeat protein